MDFEGYGYHLCNVLYFEGEEGHKVQGHSWHLTMSLKTKGVLSSVTLKIPNKVCSVRSQRERRAALRVLKKAQKYVWQSSHTDTEIEGLLETFTFTFNWQFKWFPAISYAYFSLKIAQIAKKHHFLNKTV